MYKYDKNRDVKEVFENMIENMKNSMYVYKNIEEYLEYEEDPEVDYINNYDLTRYNLLQDELRKEFYEKRTVEKHIVKQIEQYQDIIHDLKCLQDAADKEGLEELQDYKMIFFDNLIYDEKKDRHSAIFSYNIGYNTYLNIEVVGLNLEDFGGDERRVKDIEDVEIKIIDVSIG